MFPARSKSPRKTTKSTSVKPLSRPPTRHGPPKYMNTSPPPFPSFLFLHTYLVGATVIKKTVCYDSSPALHIAEARVIELSSGTSLAQFLMVFLTQRGFTFFSSMLALYAMAWRRDNVYPCSYHRNWLDGLLQLMPLSFVPLSPFLTLVLD